VKKRADEIREGDMVDLQGDVFADPAGDHVCFEFLYQTVHEAERETPSCVRIDFDNFSCGFPPSHVLEVA